VIQIISVRGADHHVKLAGEFRAESFPIAVHDVGEVVMIAPVRDNVFIYFAG